MDEKKIMSYEEFKQFAIEEIKNFFPEGEVKSINYMKTNRETEGIRVTDDIKNGIAGIIDVKAMYSNYCDEKETNVSAEYDIIQRQVKLFYEQNGIRDFISAVCKNQVIFRDVILNTVIFKPVNTALNKDYLKDIPNREYLDMSITYMCRIDESAVTVISHKVMQECGLTEQQLYDAAYRNTKRNMKIYDMKEILMELLTGVKGSEIGDSDVIDPEGKMLVITNAQKMYGAGGMLIPEALNDIAERINDDLYVIPSSLHECIIMPKGTAVPDCTSKEIAEMIYEVNMSEVDLNDRLSNNVYTYTRGDSQLRLCEYVSDRKIDGTALETQKNEKTRKNPPVQGGGAR